MRTEAAVHRRAQLGGGPGVHAIDPLRLTLRVSDGFAFDESLINAGVYAELPEANTITFALSAGTTASHARRLLRALRVAQEVDETDETDETDGDGEADAALVAAAAAAGSTAAWGRSVCTPREVSTLL